jgi:hypothetical protein
MSFVPVRKPVHRWAASAQFVFGSSTATAAKSLISNS